MDGRRPLWQRRKNYVLLAAFIPVYDDFFIFIGFVFLMVQVDIIALAFERIGIPSHYVFSALYVSFIGSLINIPVKKVPQQPMTTARRVRSARCLHRRCGDL